MQPCLLLALALLGTASASRPAPASPEAEEAALEVPEEDTRCPLESEAQVFSIHDPLSATTYRYAVVTRCQTFRRAQRTCSRCYHGRLASIHSYRINVLLKRRARLCTNRSQVWIGAVTRTVGRKVSCKWVDHSRWNYSHWRRGYPLRSRRYCTSLSINNGRWKSMKCRLRLPFVCEY